MQEPVPNRRQLTQERPRSTRRAAPPAAHDALLHRARCARDRALELLLEERKPNGNWGWPLDLYAFCGALYVIMLRTTGLVERPGAFDDECRIVRHMLTQANPDGGFHKFPGAPSSRQITHVVALSLRLVLGEVEPGARCAGWFRRNEAIDGALERDVRGAIERAERFLRERGTTSGAVSDLDHMALAKLLVAYVDWSRSFPPVPLLEPRLWAMVARSSVLTRAEIRLNRMTRKSMPAISILYGRIRERRRRCRPANEEAIQRLARRIRAEQNQSGGWFFNAIYTMLQVLALYEAGTPIDHPSIARASSHLRRQTLDAGDGGTFINTVSGDLWDTGHAVYTYLRIPGNSAVDEAIRPSVEFLLRWQCRQGGYAWGSGSPNNADNDSTAFAVRSLVLAARTAQGSMKTRLERAVRGGLGYLLPRQHRSGGFNIWDPSPVRGKRGSYGVIYQKLFDMPTADATARILEALAEVGLTTERPAVRKALRSLLRTQCRNGAWWSRWWAGYLAGTAYVLRAYGQLGLRYSKRRDSMDRLLQHSHRAMAAGADFLVRHQNADGGWGETIRADTDRRLAGVGDSTPLQTAHILSALLSSGWPADSPVVRRGIRYLLDTEMPEGSWEDHQATFTIFAGALYYPYPFMARVMPVDALTDYLVASGAEERLA